MIAKNLLIANLSKISTALLIKFRVKFADFMLKHKFQEKIFLYMIY
jgi:hypothetical protein